MTTEEKIYTGKCNGFKRDCQNLVGATWEEAGAPLILCDQCRKRSQRQHAHYHIIVVTQNTERKPQAWVVDGAWYTRQAATAWHKRHDFLFNPDPFIVIRCKERYCAWNSMELDGRVKTNGATAGG